MKSSLGVTIITLSLSACASLTGPSSEEISSLPVVRYGQAAPADGNFVLHYPAGVDLPVVAKIDGSLLSKTDQAQLKVQIKRDVFVYRHLVSFDGKNWSNGPDKIGGKFWLALPGDKHGKRDGQSPGEMAAEFNLR